MSVTPASSTQEKSTDNQTNNLPLVIITGAAGDIGTALVQRLEKQFKIVGLDVPGTKAACDLIHCDLTTDDSVHNALDQLAERYCQKNLA